LWIKNQHGAIELAGINRVLMHFFSTEKFLLINLFSTLSASQQIIMTKNNGFHEFKLNVY
jgi:hypothetical protein